MTALSFLAILFSALLHAVWNFFAKRAEEQRIETYASAFVIATILFAPCLLFEKSIPTIHGVLLTTVNGIFQAVYIMALLNAFKTSALTLVYPLSRGIGVLGTFFIEFFFMNYRGTILQILGVLCIALGTTFLSRLEIRHTNWKGVLFSTLIGFIISIAFVVSRASAREISPLQHLWGIYFVSSVVLLVYLFSFRKTSILNSLRAYPKEATIIGTGSFASYLIAVLLFKYAPTTIVVALREFSVVFGCLLGFTLLRETATFQKILQIAVIVLGALLIQWR